MALKHDIKQLLSAHCIAVAALFFGTQLSGSHAHAVGFNDQRMSSEHDAQALRAYDWVLLMAMTLMDGKCQICRRPDLAGLS